MSDYSMYVCSGCRKVFKVQGNDKKIKCNKCDAPLIDTKITYEEWNALGVDEKANIKQKACLSVNSIDIKKEKKPVRTEICPQCGSEITQGSKYCTECGYSFMPQSDTTPVVLPTIAQSQPRISGSFFDGYDDKVNSQQINTSDSQLKVNLMKCPSCGADIDVQSKKCTYCGAFITSDMRKEREMVFKEGCPKCGSSNIKFSREKQGEYRHKNKKTIVNRTVGYCQDCGYTWTPTQNRAKQDNSAIVKLILWILGWIYIFPVPAMILLNRKKDMDQNLKKKIIIAVWAVYVVFYGGIFISSLSSSSDNGETNVALSEDLNRGLPEDADAADQNIKGLSFLRTDDINVKTGETIDYGVGYLKVEVEDKNSFKPEDVEFISENPQIAKIAFTKNALTTTLYFDVTGVSEGETHIYASSKDGNIVSEKIKVNVSISEDETQAKDEEPTRTVPIVETSDKNEEEKRLTERLYATEVVNVREQPNTNSSSLGKLNVGEEILVYETASDGWSKVVYNGADGYVKSEYLSAAIQVAEVQKNDVTRSTNNTETNDFDAMDNTSRAIAPEANAIETNSGTGQGNPDAFDSYVPTGAPAGSSIIVNANNGKIHDSGCRKLPNEENRIYFNSLQDALNAGYSDRCGICKP